MIFNIINESLLYRSPLRLLEALEGEAKKSWDQGYHDEVRDDPYDDSNAKDKEYYKIGFEHTPSSGGVDKQTTDKLKSEPDDVGANAITPEIAVHIEALKDKKLYVRAKAASTLGDIGPKAEKAVPALIQALKDNSWSVRLSAVSALEKIGPKAAKVIPGLIEALKDEDWMITQSAATALVNIGPKAVPALIGAFKGKDEDIRHRVAEVLKAIGAEIPAPTQEVRPYELKYPEKLFVSKDLNTLPDPLEINRTPVSGMAEPVGRGQHPQSMQLHLIDDPDESEPGEQPEDERKRKQVIDARDAMRAQGYNIGEYLGTGAVGVVYKGPTDEDGSLTGFTDTPTVYKFDVGPNEARLADMVMKSGFSGKNGLSILPHYISTKNTGHRIDAPYEDDNGKWHGNTSLPLFAIHREDLANLDPKNKHTSRALNYLSRKLDDVFEEIEKSRNLGHLEARKKGIEKFDNHTPDIEQKFIKAGGETAKQWPRIAKELRTLMAHGIFPCDTHSDNWGIRRSTGEIAMRDVGCHETLADTGTL
jgi:hypothetical protein